MVDLCVTRVPIFAGLERADQERVAALAHPEHASAGDLLADERSVPRLLVVHTGRLKVTRLQRNGAEQLVRIAGPGDFVGESGVVSGIPSGKRVTALEDTVACAFTHEDIAGLLNARPQVALRMLGIVSRRLDDAEDRVSALTATDVRSRVAAYLLELPATRTGTHTRVTLQLAKKDVASLLDTTPESFSRALARMTRDGLIEVSGADVAILDPLALDELAG